MQSIAANIAFFAFCCFSTHVQCFALEWNSDFAFSHPSLFSRPSEKESVLQYCTQTAPNHAKAIYDAINSEAKSLPAALPDNTFSERRERARRTKNAAFVNYLEWEQNRDTVQLEKILTTIAYANTQIPAVLSYTDWQWTSKILIDYLAAYDFCAGIYSGKPALIQAEKTLETMTEKLYAEATRTVFGQSFFSTIKNNHALMTAGALGTAGIVLNRHAEAEQWFAVGLGAIENILFLDEQRQSNSSDFENIQGGYAEGPHYLRYAMLNCFHLFNGLKNIAARDVKISAEIAGKRMSIVHPYYDKRYFQLWHWASALFMADGLFPPIGDSFVGTSFPELLLTATPAYAPALSPSQWSQQLNSTVDMRAFALSSQNFEQAGKVHADGFMPEAGNCVLKNKFMYLHIFGANGKARTSAGGHNQADASSFFIANSQGVHLALDAGYVQYSRRDEVSSAASHNMILVDNAGPNPGTVGNPGDADAFFSPLLRFPPFTTTTVRTAYNGATISRTFILGSNNYVIVADSCGSIGTTEKQWTWQLHGNGLLDGDSTTGICVVDPETAHSVFTNRNASLDCFLANVSRNDLTTKTSVHETEYDKTAEHTIFGAVKEGQSSHFLAALFVDAETQPDFRLEPQCLNATAASAATKNDGRDYWAKALGKGEIVYPISSQQIASDADVLAISVDEQRKIQAIMTQGAQKTTIVNLETATTLKQIVSDKPAAIGLQFPDDNTFSVTVSVPMTISIRPISRPTALYDDNGQTPDTLYKVSDSTLVIAFQTPATVYGIVQTTGLSEMEDSWKYIKTTPNPVSGYLRAELPDNTIEITIVNATGNVIYTERNPDTIFTTDCRNIPSGVYYIHAATPKVHAVSPIVVLQ